MGKRELLIIAAFVVIGTVAYQLTAPDPKPGERAFSLSGLMNAVRREVRGNPANASDRREGTFAIAATLAEVRIAGATKVTIVGEDRADIAYDLTVDAAGPDEATARGYAKRAWIKNDDMGDVLALRVGSPSSEARQTSALLLRIPSRLAVRLEQSAARNVNVSDVAAVHIDGGYGDITLVNVSGAVTGSSRGGDLVLQDVGTITMTLRNTSAKVIRPRGLMRITATGGECLIDHAAGPIEFEQTNGAEVKITAPQASVRATGNTGEITVTDPKKDVTIDVRRAEIEVSLDQGVPVSVLATDEPVRLLLGDGISIALDALATEGGSIESADFALTPERRDQESKLLHAFGAGGVRVLLRTQRGEIVIRKRK